MPSNANAELSPCTPVLLIETNLAARTRHETALRTAGYAVQICAACPEPAELAGAAILVSDVPSFHWIQDRGVGRLPPILVLADDVREGVTACLCGAGAWVPVGGDDAYFLDAVADVLGTRLFRTPSHARADVTAAAHERR